MTDLVLVPASLALLPAYASRVDPVPEVRAAVESAVAWLVERSEGLVVVAGPDRTGDPSSRPDTPAALRIARALAGSALPVAEVVLGGVGAVTAPTEVLRPGCGVLVVTDGSARRSVKAPGHLDERSFGLDASVEAALRSGDPARFADLDADLAEELLCGAVPVLQGVATALAGQRAAQTWLDLSVDPYGVQYWVARWSKLR